MCRFLKRSFETLLVVVAVIHPLMLHGQQLTFTTLAGPREVPGSIDGTASAARFNFPLGVATDSRGNIYVADSVNHTIRKITPAGAVTTLAGLAGHRGSVDGMGSAARFNWPAAVATDNRGNVYVADSSNFTIRKITPEGSVTTLANGAQFGTYVGGPQGITADSAGNVYVAETAYNSIRKITPAGAVTTWAGHAGALFGSADGTGNEARFHGPRGLATDSGGNIYVADTNNHKIRKITPEGKVTTLAGRAATCGSSNEVGSPDCFSSPEGVATDGTGNVYVADSRNNSIKRIDAAGTVSTLAGVPGIYGSNDGLGDKAFFGIPRGLAIDSSGNVYVADTENHTIRKISAAREVTTFAGRGERFGGSADGIGDDARFADPVGVATDSNGNVYVADTDDHTIRKITPGGVVTTLAGRAGEIALGPVDGKGSAARFSYPQGVATDRSANIYVADTFNHTIRKITPSGEVTTFAGDWDLFGCGRSADGKGKAARICGPSGIAIDTRGNVYVAESFNHTIRKITSSGSVTTLAGLARADGSADGRGSAARFHYPRGVATDSQGNVYVADTDNHTIRKISAAGVVTTLAGLALHTGSVDGTGSEARFDSPRGVAVDTSGNVYVADTGNRTIRRITPAGVVTTVGGIASNIGTSDGTGSASRFYIPTGVATDSSGNIYVVTLKSIRKGSPALSEIATIDQAAGAAGATRVLDTEPQRATSWQWSVIRRPADSVAELSSATVRNPTFAPDAVGLFTFRLIATSATGMSITTVDFTSLPPQDRRRAARH